METDTLTAPDAEETAMRELGVETDHAQGREDVEAAPKPEAVAPESPEPTQPEAEQPPESPDTETREPGDSRDQWDKDKQRPRDPVTGKYQKPDTDYSRAQKEAARKERSWQALQAEKEQFRMMTSQWEEQQRMAQLESQRKNYQPLKKEGLTAQEYFQGAQRFVQEGDFENAYKAHQVGLQLHQAETQRAEQMRGAEREYHWRSQMNEIGKTHPEIWQEPIAGHLQRIIANNEWLYDVPGGFTRAAEVAHMLSKMGELKEKDDRIVALEAELEKHQRKGQPSKGGYASPRTGEKDFDDMNLDEMESHLRSMTSEADSWR